MKILIEGQDCDLQKKLLRDQLKKRIPVSFGKGGTEFHLVISDAIGKEESYEITEEPIYGPKNLFHRYTITGSDSRGLSYGIGKFLHTAKWTEKDFTADYPKGVQSPDCSFRCMYFSIHFYNWYHMAPTDELEEYLTELLLYGYSSIVGIVPVINMHSFDDEVAKPAIQKNRELFRLCRKLGMKTGLIVCVNQGLYYATPDDILADDGFAYDRVTGAPIRPRSGVNVCISNPKGYEYMRWVFENEMQLFTETGLDYVISFPYDEGGCGCEKCRPWGAKGYVEGCKLLNEVATKYYPNIQFIAPTWMFDYGQGENEYEGFYQRLKTDGAFIHSIMVDSHDWYPQYPLEHPLIKPVVGFPEISMWKLFPWGGFGANPMPERFQEIWDEQKRISDGGMPYSEGMYEDISKIQFVGYYWDKEKNYREILEEYANFEFSSVDKKDIVDMMVYIGRNHTDVGYGKVPDYEIAVKAYEIAERVNKRMSKRARKNWRWRILYIRAVLDYKRYTHFHLRHFTQSELGQLRHTSADWFYKHDRAAEKLLKELCKLYHCANFYNDRNRYTKPVYNNWTKFYDDVDHGQETST